MSVVVKGMEMPKNCLTCKLRGDGSDSRYIWDCPFTGFEYTREEGEAGRLGECPIVEVPATHGRLIDVDALVELLDKEYRPTYAVKLFKSLLNAQPTVIEAEGTE